MVNADEYEIMHMRNKDVKRSGQKFVMNGEAVQNVAEFYYVGYAHVESTAILDLRARLRRCGISVGR